MNTSIRYLSLGLLAVFLSTVGFAAEMNDAVFKAMQDEMDRSVKKLVIENMSRPYFISYRVEDQSELTIEARYGGLVKSQRSVDRYLYTDLRVGDSTLDNTNYVGDWGDLYRMREDLAEEDDYAALRHEIWLATDKAYKNALENLARKKSYLQTHPARESLNDFAAAEHDNVTEPAAPLPVDATAWERTVKAASEALRAYPALQDWKVTYRATTKNKRFVNSEGARNRRGLLIQAIEVSATAQAADGQRLTAFRQFVTRDGENPPQGEELARAVGKMAEDLRDEAAAPVLDEYSGPVLFSDYASAQLISQLFAGQLTLSRDILTPEDWMSQYLPKGKLADRVNRRVFPDFVTVTDDPTMTTDAKGHRLLGTQTVDDEGVQSRAITLVKDGRLITLPSTRQPTKKVPKSNGHAHTYMNQWTLPAVTNLTVKSSKPLASAQMIEKLRQLARDSGNEYGLLITLLEDTRISDEYSWMEPSQSKPKLLASPIIVFKVYAKDGRMEPVRGLDFDDVTIRSLRDVAAMGKDEQLYSIEQATIMPRIYYPVSILTPAILIEEMELKSNPVQEPKPLSANPLFEK